jgi:uncharacterized protein (DUF924 family)
MHNKILEFWFDEIEPRQWWQKSDDFDRSIGERFGELHSMAKAGELSTWRETPQGALAEVIILDQFSRNIYRDKPESFACDPMAVALSQCAIAKGFDRQLRENQRVFFYMTFMHSESRIIHQQAMKYFEALGIESSLEFEIKHKAIIDKFGRYPHRNHILGRSSTDEEIEFLKLPNSGF